MKMATASPKRTINMFHGRRQFGRALRESGLPQERRRAFSRRLHALFTNLNEEYSRGSSPKRLEAIAGLSDALSKVHKEPFSRLVSPYVDIQTGEPTELGELVAMPKEFARRVNGPKSELISLMHSLEPEVPFSELVNYSYNAFGYARSGITNASPGEPLSWLPLGNSIFISKLAEELASSNDSITVINLGAGPGALEGMILSKLKEFLPRIKILSVEQDKASLKAIGNKVREASGVEWKVVEGNFTDLALQREISTASSANPFAVCGYSMHHASPKNVGQVLSWLTSISWHRNAYVQVHDVSGGKEGGGQSPVNRIFFNFMPLFHLSVFQPDKEFAKRAFTKMFPKEAAEAVKNFPEFFIDGTTPVAARKMLANGSISVFTKQCDRDYYYSRSYELSGTYPELRLLFPKLE
ncbi:hypothetical protein JW721_02960 [Candidatus Micrarchaeota archaeon]|nr:hypothetical protein [Candidatus Micrarchaeota archaeon]